MSGNFYGGFQSPAFQTDYQTTLIVTDIGPTLISLLPPYVNKIVPKLSDCYIDLQYQDIFQNAVTPVSVLWRLWDDTNKIQLQDWTALNQPTQNDIVHISETLNAITNSNNLVEARVFVAWVTVSGGAQRYDSFVFYVLTVPDVP